MRREKINGALDRQIVTAMVTSDIFLREIRDIYDRDFLAAPYAAVVAEWCLSYFKKYGKAPGKRIQDRYDRALSENELRDDATEKLIGDFLGGLSVEYDASSAEINAPFLLDEAERLFKKRDLSLLADELKDMLERSPEDAEDLLRKHKRVERAQAGGFDPFTDAQQKKAMFGALSEPLITFDGALGELINPLCTRDQLIGVMGPEKSGKTFGLTEFGNRGIMARCNVALFETGDLSESQLMRRFHSSLSGHRMDERFARTGGRERRSVVDCVRGQLGLCRKSCCRTDTPLRSRMDERVDELPEGYRPCTACQEDFIPCVGYLETEQAPLMTPATVEESSRRILAHMGTRKVRFHVTPSNTMTAEGMNDQLLRWKEREGFVPDIIICDYADIMAQEPGTRDERSTQNERWKWFRRMSQEWHALFVVATQTDALAYDKDSVNLNNFSEDKRKYSHVTAMLAIHRTAAERQARCLRMSLLLGREVPSDLLEDEVVLCERLNVSRIHTASFWRKHSRLGSEYRYKPRLVNGGIVDNKETEE